MTRIKKPAAALAVTAVVTMGTAVSSNTLSEAFGAEAGALPLGEALVDAARAFSKVDMNQDGLVDEDEFAAQRVVYAQLARFNRVVPVDGHDVVSIAVPEAVPQSMSHPERAALDAIARRDYHMRVLAEPGLTQQTWSEWRLETFRSADRNRDGILAGRELDTYAMLVAGELSAGVSGI
ncbi:MAG: hypothetical protein V2I43_18095 [Parvularcula sp.]|jgi:hypothetical protein|nr:hypothetical protein [Parvularcula sp.]